MAAIRNVRWRHLKLPPFSVESAVSRSHPENQLRHQHLHVVVVRGSQRDGRKGSCFKSMNRENQVLNCRQCGTQMDTTRRFLTVIGAVLAGVVGIIYGANIGAIITFSCVGALFGAVIGATLAGGLGYVVGYLLGAIIGWIMRKMRKE